MSNIDGKINYCVYIGDTFKATLTIKDKVTQEVIDVSSYTFKMQIRACKDNSIIIHELNSPTAIDGIDTSNGTNGIITLNISSTDTLTFTEQNAVYDLFWIDNLGEYKTIQLGNFQILERITKN
jgi:hypothetical protein